MTKLPVKRRDGLQRKHVRRYKSGKITVVNPNNRDLLRSSVKKRVVPGVVPSKESSFSKQGAYDKRKFSIDKEGYKKFAKVVLPEQGVAFEVPESGYDFFYKQSLIMFFIGWRRRLKNWSFQKKSMLAIDVDKLAGMIPIHLPNFKDDVKVVNSILEQAGVRLIKYDQYGFILFDDGDGSVIAEGISSLRMYALFIYLVNELSNGSLKDMTGFGFIKEAEAMSKFF